MKFRRATEMAHDLIRERVKSGDLLIDATVGNGHDTLFLADLCGPDGRVFGFDIQPNAIDETTRKLDQVEWLGRATLFENGHEEMEEKLADWKGKIHAVMLNLGYLPGGDKSVVTKSETTVSALRGAVGLLAEGGLITIVVYTGHPGAKAEAEAVVDFAADLNQAEFSVTRYGFLNQVNDPPFLIAIERMNKPC